MPEDAATDRPLESDLPVREIWEANAEFWDDHIGPEGNAFHRRLVAPVQLDLLRLQPGERVLEVACGNGQFARQMARLGARVVATDLSRRFIQRARRHTAEAGITTVTYAVADATDEAQLLALGTEPFDAAVCTMALMDMAAIEPLARSLPRLLRPNGRFVFTVLHPCFNNPTAQLFAETVDVETRVTVRRGVKVTGYLNLPPQRGIGISGQPEAHYYFHRPLSELLEPFFRAGFVLDALREPAFPAEGASGELSWDALPQLPPVLAARLRLAG